MRPTWLFAGLLGGFLLCLAPLYAADRHEASGEFLGIEQGDYAYFRLRTDAGEELSLLVLQTDNGLQPFVDDPEALIGRRVRVWWETTTQNIPEAGGAMEVELASGAELLPD